MKNIISIILLISPYLAAADSSWYEVKTTEEPIVRTFQGQVEAIQQATVSAQTSGRVARIHVDVDDYVTAGTVIIEFTNQEQKQAVERARANLEAAKATENRPWPVLNGPKVFSA
jgi:Multidrug resistance efflux pump